MAFNLVNFKKGTLAGLESLKTNSGVEEGTFYLTIDDAKNTSRLFIGTGAKTALPVNSNIVVVTSVDDLTNAHATNFNDGDFAYVTTGNILAVRYNGVWTQINAPDSKTVKDLTASVATSNGTATITWTLRDQSNNVIHTSDSTAQNPITPNITMTGANGISVSGTGTAVTVTGTSYNLGTDLNENDDISITLWGNSGGNSRSDNGEVILLKGNNVTFTGVDGEGIAINATDTHLDSNSLTIANNSTAGFDITVQDTGNNSDTATLNPKITLGTHTAAAEQISFVDGVANLSVYTKDEIDSQNRALNALEYKGTVGTNGSAASSISQLASGQAGTLKIGWVYKYIGEGEDIPAANGGGSVKNGDLIIANGTEAGNGFILSGLRFDIIPSGDDINDYTLEPATHGVTLEESGVAKGSFSVAEGTAISLSDNTTGDDRVVTINHGNVVRTDGTGTAITQTAGADKQFTVVTGVTSNAQGHITGITTTSVTVKDSVAAMSNVSSAASAASNVATVTTTVGLTPYTGATASTAQGSFKLRSDNLTVTAPTVASGAAPEVKINFTWGSF